MKIHQIIMIKNGDKTIQAAEEQQKKKKKKLNQN